MLTARTGKGPFRPGLDAESALDVLLMLLGSDVYQAFVRGRGWTHDHWLAWIKVAVTEALYGRPRGA